MIVPKSCFVLLIADRSEHVPSGARPSLMDFWLRLVVSCNETPIRQGYVPGHKAAAIRLLISRPGNLRNVLPSWICEQDGHP